MEGEKKKILVVEDEKPMARVLELKLSYSGFLTKSVFNGEEALNLLKTEKFDLMLLDLMMPKVDGFSVLEEIKKIGLNLPVFVLSNLSQTDDEKKAKELGAIKFFIKSDTPINQIIESIKKYFEK